MIIDGISEPLAGKVRQVIARVELYEGSTLIDTYSYNDILKSVYVYQTGVSSKFFGFCIGQKLNVHILDKDRVIDITTAHSFKVYLTLYGYDYVDFAPTFYVTETHRNETTGELSITAYDALEKAYEINVAGLELVAPYSVRTVAESIASKLGLTVDVRGLKDWESCFDTVHETGANFDGTENLRDVLGQIAEATQTVCFVDRLGNLVFKRPDRDSEPVYTITKHDILELDTSPNKRLGTIASVTDLGDNVSASIDESGSTQYIRNNPFLDLRDDIGTLIDNAIEVMGGLTVAQVECWWRGNFLLEPCDKIGVVTRDGTVVYLFVYDNVITYDGTYSHETRWAYEDDTGVTALNQTNLGDILKDTYAQVDKSKREIILNASRIEDNSAQISNLRMDTESVSASVKEVESYVNENTEAIETLTKEVEAKVTADSVQIQIESALENGVSSVRTKTGFTFDEEGLHIAKDDSNIETTLSEDGLEIHRGFRSVLVVNNEGVKAEDLQATTYLIIGENSRFEDYYSRGPRTGCFWIGTATV